MDHRSSSLAQPRSAFAGCGVRPGDAHVQRIPLAFPRPVAGNPLAVYLGDDAPGEYAYKFVMTATWQASDATTADRTQTLR